MASSADQAVGVRLPDGTGRTADALAERTIVKTWALRGTLHLLAADDAGAYLSLLAAARTWEKPAWQREFATTGQMAAIAEAAAAALDGAVLTRRNSPPRSSTALVTDRWGRNSAPDGARCSNRSPGRACCATPPARATASRSPARRPGCRTGKGCPTRPTPRPSRSPPTSVRTARPA